MKILFIFSRHSADPTHSTLTKDLSDYFYQQGHDVYIATIREKREKKQTNLEIENGCHVLRVKCGNYFSPKNKFEKGITVLKMPKLMKNAIIKNLGDIDFNLIYTHTPFMASHNLIKPLKKHFNCKTLLNLWDIFPQNAVDLKLITNSFLIKFFKKNELKALKSFDYIACMSTGNIEYIQKNYPPSLHSKLFLLKNWAPYSKLKKTNVRAQYNLKDDHFIVVFGGNIGVPQAITNLIQLAPRFKNQKVTFLFVGNGTDAHIVEAAEKENSNIRYIKSVARNNYEKLLSSCDLALVSLDSRFTVPNFPSKTTDYFKLAMPVLASLDKCAYHDYGDFLETQARAGYRVLAENTDQLSSKLQVIIDNSKTRNEMGKNGRKYFEENLTTKNAYQTIMSQLKNAQK